MSSLFNIWYSIQHTLFPWLENELDPLTEKQRAGPKLAGHVSRDATQIDAREKPFRKELKSPQSKPQRKRGRPRQGEAKAVKEPKRLDLQLGRSLAENMADLPTRCDVGTKFNAKGYKTTGRRAISGFSVMRSTGSKA